MANLKESTTFAGGCFWCMEAIFEMLKGVESVVSGYAGGDVDDPDYYHVSSGETGHAEAIQVTYDPSVISYNDLLDVFWHLHDPTTMNRQGADVGTQYRSVIFYHDEEQRQKALASKTKLEQDKVYSDPIVTQISPLIKFFPAEDYHQQYYENNPNQPYCKLVIDPKILKLKKDYQEKLK